MDRAIKKILIIGGGTAGWMAASAIARTLGRSAKITLVESEEIGTVGVGEATIPPILNFIEMLGIDENEFVRRTNATFKLGIEFVNWGAKGERYMHPFGKYGYDMQGISFHHYWMKMRQTGDMRPLEDYALQAVAARAGKFTRPLNIERSPLASIAYAFHFDAGLFARFLREYSEGLGVTRIEAKVAHVHQRADDGFLESVLLDNGTQISADLFIDCTGFRGLLIEQTLQAGYEDWSHWLPCNSAIAVPCENAGPPLPYTRATAHDAGWQWRIGLQNRIGNGHVYCNEYISDDAALATLLASLDGKPLADPRQLRFTTGRRKKSWVKNCVALGLSSGFMEPLESTSIHMIQSALLRLMAFFPSKDFDPHVTAEYNRRTAEEYEYIRDFLILHYNATSREDSEFWRFGKNRKNPDSLQRKIDLFHACGQISYKEEELFKAANWLAVLTGQNFGGARYHPFADMVDTEEVRRRLAAMLQTIDASVDHMPPHEDYIAEHIVAQ
ncbi:tryptophan halogenase family protein [Sphingorhabdus arenilitoris]|uniref:Tryptophan halogenase family protein n=1 Tax=Sphingorhabdus arenilitoris TaxID=1490041 RepID=A0ABV8RJ05_9SPHN